MKKMFSLLVGLSIMLCGSSFADSVEVDVLDQTGTFDEDQSGTDFGSAAFTNGNATLSGTFDNCTWTAIVGNAYGEATWSGSFKNNIFSDAGAGLTWGDKANGSMDGGDFSGSQFLMGSGSSFRKLNARGANFNDTVWARDRNNAGNYWRQADLSGSTFSNAYFETDDKLFNGPDLTNCVFVDATFNVSGSVLNEAKNVKIGNADFSGAVFSNGAIVMDGNSNGLNIATWDATRVEITDRAFTSADLSDLTFGADGSGENFELFGNTKTGAVFKACVVNSNTTLTGLDFNQVQMNTNLATDLGGAGIVDESTCTFGSGGTAPSKQDFIDEGWSVIPEPSTIGMLCLSSIGLMWIRRKFNT